MSVMSELHLDIQEMLLNGDKTFDEIAALLEVPMSWVAEVSKEMHDEHESMLYEAMDGDHDSAMASAGFGTDEDYGYYGGA